MFKGLMATLINVLGTSRSGSTALHAMLGHGPRAFACGEVASLYFPFQTHHFTLSCPCLDEECQVWPRILNDDPSRFHLNVVKRLGVDHVVDNSKNPVWVLDAQKWAAEAQMAVVNLAIWKDPVDLAFSFWKRGKDAMSWRRDFVNYYGRLLRLEFPMITVKQGELAQAPAATLQSLCGLIGMPYFEGKERFWESEQHPVFGSRGVRDQLVSGQGRETDAEFPAEFLKSLSTIEESKNSDPDVVNVISRLERADHFLADPGDLPHVFSHRGPYPPWYYIKKVRRALKRRFPSQSRPGQI